MSVAGSVSRFWMKVVVFKMAQSLERINEGFFEHFKSFISSLHSLVYLFII